MTQFRFKNKPSSTKLIAFPAGLLVAIGVFTTQPLHAIANAPTFTISESESGIEKLTLNDQETFVVQGQVMDPEGMPLPGASVLEAGTTNGTQTDFEGNFSLEVSSDQATIEISYMGFATQEIDLNGRNSVTVNLQYDAAALEEVVVVGYGTQRKKDLTGSVTSIRMDDAPPAANMNLAQALRGSAAGLNVEGGSAAGSEPSFSIRGRTSLSASTSPLIVVNGVIFNGTLSDINIADVEQIDVLKGASAAAVYGSRSANGVVLITTKRGRTGEGPSIRFNTYHGLQDYTDHPVKMMNAQQYAQRLVDYDYFQSLYNWYGNHPTGPNDFGGKPVHPGYEQQAILDVLKSDDERENYLAGNEIDWIDEITRTAPLHNYDLSISGAGEGFNYYVSGSFTDQEGVLRGDEFTRSTVNTRVEGDLLDWFTVGLNSSYSHRDHSGLSAPMNHARNASPLASIYDQEGNYPVRFNGEFLMAHPLRFDHADNKDIRKNFFATGYAKIRLPWIPGLTYDFNYSHNNYSTSNKTFYPRSVYEGNSINGRATINNSDRTNWIYNHIINYQNLFAEKHAIDVTLVYTRDHTFWEGSNMDANRFSSEALGYNDVGLAEQFTIGSGAWEENSLGYMARLNYRFNDRYLLTGTYRRDGYSGFGTQNKFVDFFAISAAWNISEESFMEGTRDWLDHLKIRVSSGENGNQGIGAYSSLSKLGTRYYIFGPNSAIGMIPTSLGNSGLGWETTHSNNLGVDFALFGNRLSGIVDVYQSSSKDVLVNRSLPGASGYTSVWANIGEIQNRGVEVSLSSVNLEGPLRWESRFVFSLNRNEIKELYGDGRDDIGNQWFIGQPIGAIYDYNRTGGLWTEEELYNGQILDGFYPGQFRLEDINGDNRITPGEDRTIVGYTEPNYRFSIGNDLYYKNFSLSVFINSIQGGNGYYKMNLRSLLEATSDFDYAHRANQPAIRENWTPDNGVDDAPAIYNYPSVSSGNYQDRSFVRLQDVSLAYDFTDTVLDPMGLESFQLYLTGKNLYTWTDFEGYDPETGMNLLMRSVSLGARFSF